MMHYFTSIVLSLFLLANVAVAQQSAEEYTQVITQRSQKIVDKLEVSESNASKILPIIVQQYRNLNDVQEAQEADEKKIKSENEEAVAKTKIGQLNEKADQKLAKFHKQYLAALGKYLNQEQIEKVKNEMTYNVLPITYSGYLEMLPALTTAQKEQILAYLTEAREKAMDAGTSKQKHWWFGKYKGRINNYLSKEGVETKEARKIWEQKLKEKEAAKQAKS